MLIEVTFRVDVVITLSALILLMVVAYRGYSVIAFAPVAALLAVLFTEPAWVAPMFSGVFMDKLVGFLKLYFPVFLLGAIFGKLIELSGFAKAIVAAGEGYGSGHRQEPEPVSLACLPHPLLALVPLLLVIGAYRLFGVV